MNCPLSFKTVQVTLVVRMAPIDAVLFLRYAYVRAAINNKNEVGGNELFLLPLCTYLGCGSSCVVEDFINSYEMLSKLQLARFARLVCEMVEIERA